MNISTVKKEVLADSSDDEESSEDEELAPNSVCKIDIILGFTAIFSKILYLPTFYRKNPNSF